MKYQVIYYTNKRKKKTATFFTIEDAMFWENYVKDKGYKDSQILVR